MLHDDALICDLLTAELDRDLRVQLHDPVLWELLPVGGCKLAEVLPALFEVLIAEGSFDVEV